MSLLDRGDRHGASPRDARGDVLQQQGAVECASLCAVAEVVRIAASVLLLASACSFAAGDAVTGHVPGWTLVAAATAGLARLLIVNGLELNARHWPRCQAGRSASMKRMMLSAHTRACA